VRIKLAPVFLLDEPHYHRVTPGATHRFRGLALAIDGPPIEMLRAGSIDVPVNLPSPDLASFVRLPGADACRFDFQMRYDGPFDFVANGETVWRYEVPAGTRLNVDRFPPPPSDVIAVTQGGGNVDAYRDSIASGLTTMKALLGRDPRSVLDIGCGTGRLLIGWHADDPTRRLAGVDINPDLIGWNQQNLSGVADWSVCALSPPLRFPDASFDLIQMISVLTHLPLDRQREWIAEVRRLLRPGGQAVITLHGELYARLLLEGDLRAAYDRDGHVAVAGAAEGANAFASFHQPAFARELLGGAEFHERGPRNLFPIASLQDVYVVS
jgi:SAM-dependent methyltransferase